MAHTNKTLSKLDSAFADNMITALTSGLNHPDFYYATHEFMIALRGYISRRHRRFVVDSAEDFIKLTNNGFIFFNGSSRYSKRGENYRKTTGKGKRSVVLYPENGNCYRD